MLLAVFAIFLAPISPAMRAKTVFTEACVALASVMSPRPEPSLLATTQGFGLALMNAGDEESILNDGGIPSLSAVTRTNVLNDDPGCRLPCVARLNLRLLEVPAAHERLHVSVARVDADQGALRILLARQLLADRILGVALQPRIQRGAHHQATLEDSRGTELGLELLLHVRNEVGRRVDPIAGRLRALQLHLLGERLLVLGFGDVAVSEHLDQHVVAALQRTVRVVVRVESARLLRQAREHGCLRQRELACLFREVGARCRLRPVGSVAEVDGVEVHLEDLLLGVALLEFGGEVRLARLPGERDVGTFVEKDGVAHVLLGDRRGTFRAEALREVDHHGAAQTDEVHPVVLVEAFVLGRYDTVHQVRRYLRDRHDFAVLEIHPREELPVRRVDPGRLCDFEGAGLVGIGQVVEPAADDRGRSSSAHGHGEEQDAEAEGKNPKRYDLLAPLMLLAHTCAPNGHVPPSNANRDVTLWRTSANHMPTTANRHPAVPSEDHLL